MSGQDRRWQVRRLPSRALPVGVVALAGLLYTINILLGGPGPSLVSWAGAAAGAAAAGSLWYAVRRAPRSATMQRPRNAWRWFIIAALCRSAGSIMDGFTGFGSESATVPLSLSDLFFVGAMAALATGLLGEVRRPRDAHTWLRFTADIYVCVAALFVLGWVLVFGRLYHLSGESPAQFVFEIVYPLADVVLVCAVLPFVLGVHREYRRSASVAYTALLALAVADIAMTVERLGGGPEPGEFGNAAQVCALLTLGAVPWLDWRRWSAARRETGAGTADGASGAGGTSDRRSGGTSGGAVAGAGLRTGEHRVATHGDAGPATEPYGEGEGEGTDEGTDDAARDPATGVSPISTGSSGSSGSLGASGSSGSSGSFGTGLSATGHASDLTHGTWSRTVPVQAGAPEHKPARDGGARSGVVRTAAEDNQRGVPGPRTGPAVDAGRGASTLGVPDRQTPDGGGPRGLGSGQAAHGDDQAAVDAGTGRMVGPGIAPAAAAAAAALFIAGRSLTASHGADPVVSLIAGSSVLIMLARLVDLLRENNWLRRAVDSGDEHFRALAESINDAVLICDVDGMVQYISPNARGVYGYSQDDLLRRPVQDFLHPEDLPRVQEVLAEFLGGCDEVLRLACRVRAVDGTWLPTESTILHYSRGDGDGGGRLLIITRDLSEQAALQRQVAHLTFHDGLTGLPNRAYFEERVREVLTRQHDLSRIAVVFTDLDGFTAINDSAGHAAGDQVLAQAARRLRGAVQADDTVARWGGDEFVVLVENAAEAQTAVELAERMLRVLSTEPYRVGDRGIALTASVGIAYAEEGLDSAVLIRNGDLAMARAKELGGGRVEVFAAHMHADVVRRLELGGDLQRALAEEQFAIEFQPVVELATSRVTGVEALVRWWRGNTSVPPEEFIGPAEESGLMIPLGDWILREACRTAARWRAESWEIGLSVNFTARQIAAPRFVESVAAVLEETGLPPHALTLEVKEEVLVEDGGQNVDRLSSLRDLGVRLAIDDFGTGYASLAYLGQLPVDIIKIDPSFVAGLGRDDTLTLLTRTIVQLGRDLGLTVVAEGIERPEQLELLRQMKCPSGQGFLVARPMAAGRVESLVRTSLKGKAAIPLQDQALTG